MENHNGEKLVSFNLERIKYWMAKKARVTNPVAELLGMCVSLITFKVIIVKCNELITTSLKIQLCVSNLNVKVV